jgi:ABC-type sugar transport system substrate-binding protein
VDSVDYCITYLQLPVSVGVGDPVPVVTWTGSSHYDFGYMQGQQVAALMADSFAKSSDLKVLEDWLNEKGSQEARRGAGKRHPDVAH